MASGPGIVVVRPGSRRRRWVRWGMLLTVVLVGVVLVLATQFVRPMLHPGAPIGSPGPPPKPDFQNASFSVDRVLADRLALNLTGGPWKLVGAHALATGSPARVPLDQSGASGCPLIPNPYATMASVSIPPQSLVDGRGRSALWTFDYVAPDGSGLRLATEGGSATAIGHLDFNRTSCHPPGPSPVVIAPFPIDSTTAGNDALNLGGDGFLSEYASASVSYSLEPRAEPGAGGGPVDQWNITFDGCGTSPSASTYTEFGEVWTVWLDAATGQMESYGSSARSCPQGSASPIPYALSEGLNLNAPVRTSVGASVFFNASIATTCCGLTLENLSAQIHPVGSAVPPASVELRLVSANGSVLCTAAPVDPDAFSFACPAPLVEGELFSVELPSAGTGEMELTIDGVWDFAGELVVPLYEATSI